MQVRPCAIWAGLEGTSADGSSRVPRQPNAPDKDSLSRVRQDHQGQQARLSHKIPLEKNDGGGEGQISALDANQPI